MRIAYVCADQGVPVFGNKGCSVHVQEMLRAFFKRGHDATLFASRLGGNRPPGWQDIRVVELPARRGENAQQRERLAIKSNAQVARLIDEAGPFDLVYERFSLWSYGAMELARASGWPSVLEINAPLVDEQSKHRQLVDRELAETAAARAFSAAQVLAAVSEEVARWVRVRAAGEADVRVVPNGVCHRRFGPHIPPRRSDLAEKFTVGFVGTLRPWHGVDQLLDAFVLLQRECADAQLLIVGDGPRREELTHRIEQLPKHVAVNIHLPGAVPVEEVPRWINSMRVGVAPYPDLPDFYFSPLKVFEYMAAGRAVVASGVGQMNSIIAHGQNGLLVPPGDARSLADALISLYQQPSLAVRLGAAARQAVVERHTWDRVAQRMIDLAMPATSPIAV